MGTDDPLTAHTELTRDVPPDMDTDDESQHQLVDVPLDVLVDELVDRMLAMEHNRHVVFSAAYLCRYLAMHKASPY